MQCNAMRWGVVIVVAAVLIGASSQNGRSVTSLPPLCVGGGTTYTYEHACRPTVNYKLSLRIIAISEPSVLNSTYL